jgi:tellurite resistance protein TehA-like permease
MRRPPLFSVVMATGVVSLLARQVGLAFVSSVLLALTAALYLLLLARHAIALSRRPSRVISELGTPRAFEYLTIVAAGGVLGSGLLLVGADMVIGWALLVLSGIVWLTICAWLTVDLAHHSLHPSRELRSIWLLAVVAPQSLSVLAIALLNRSGPRALATLAVALWLLGSALYPPIALGRVRRLGVGWRAATRVRPDDWILMGALAISAVAASRLLDLPAGDRMPAPIHTIVLAGATIELVLAAGFIPLLVWDELAHLLRFHNAPPVSRRWVTVFPLGMFALACHTFASAIGLRSLAGVGEVCSAVALAVWLTTGMLAAAHRAARLSRHHRPLNHPGPPSDIHRKAPR